MPITISKIKNIIINSNINKITKFKICRLPEQMRLGPELCAQNLDKRLKTIKFYIFQDEAKNVYDTMKDK